MTSKRLKIPIPLKDERTVWVDIPVDFSQVDAAKVSKVLTALALNSWVPPQTLPDDD